MVDNNKTLYYFNQHSKEAKTVEERHVESCSFVNY